MLLEQVSPVLPVLSVPGLSVTADPKVEVVYSGQQRDKTGELGRLPRGAGTLPGLRTLSSRREKRADALFLPLAFWSRRSSRAPSATPASRSKPCITEAGQRTPLEALGFSCRGK